MELSAGMYNMNAFRRRLNNYPEALKRELKEIGLETALVDIETEAKLKLTRDKHIDTGHLRASIHTEYEGSPMQILGGVSGPLDFVVGTKVVYAWKIEKLDSYVIWAFRRAKPKYMTRCNQAIRRALNGL